jgi:hypothetical protein
MPSPPQGGEGVNFWIPAFAGMTILGGDNLLFAGAESGDFVKNAIGKDRREQRQGAALPGVRKNYGIRPFVGKSLMWTGARG